MINSVRDSLQICISERSHCNQQRHSSTDSDSALSHVDLPLNFEDDLKIIIVMDESMHDNIHLMIDAI